MLPKYNVIMYIIHTLVIVKQNFSLILRTEQIFINSDSNQTELSKY